MKLNYFNNYIRNNNLVIVFFYSNNYPLLIEKINTIKDDCAINDLNNLFLYIDCENEENLELIEDLFIKSIPLFHIYKNNIMIEEIFGNYKNIEHIINLHI
jgi:hypothetical protein